MGDHGREHGRKTEILDGKNTFFYHLFITLLLRCQCQLANEDRHFKFNTSFLYELKLIVQLQEEWNLAPWPTSGGGGWQEWVAAALTRVKEFY
jgi:hypothetical protein